MIFETKKKNPVFIDENQISSAFINRIGTLVIGVGNQELIFDDFSKEEMSKIIHRIEREVFGEKVLVE